MVQSSRSCTLVGVGLKSVRNHIKLEICSFVMNFNSGEFSLRVRQAWGTVLWILDRDLADLWGVADMHCQKVEITK